MAGRNTEKRFLKGLREYDFVGLLRELFDEDYAKEVLESYKSAEFIKNKGGIYIGKIKTDMHTFYVAFRRDKDGYDILRFEFK